MSLNSINHKQRAMEAILTFLQKPPPPEPVSVASGTCRDVLCRYKGGACGYCGHHLCQAPLEGLILELRNAKCKRKEKIFDVLVFRYIVEFNEIERLVFVDGLTTATTAQDDVRFPGIRPTQFAHVSPRGLPRILAQVLWCRANREAHELLNFIVQTLRQRDLYVAGDVLAMRACLRSSALRHRAAWSDGVESQLVVRWQNYIDAFANASRSNVYAGSEGYSDGFPLEECVHQLTSFYAEFFRAPPTAGFTSTPAEYVRCWTEAAGASGECPICFETGLRLGTVGCSHAVCSECWSAWVGAGGTNCPTCRAPAVLT